MTDIAVLIETCKTLTQICAELHKRILTIEDAHNKLIGEIGLKAGNEFDERLTKLEGKND